MTISVTQVDCSSESNRRKTVGITLPRILVKKARKHRLDISRIAERALFSVINRLESQSHGSSEFLGELSFQKKVQWAGPDLNRRSSPREGDVLAELDYRPICTAGKCFRISAYLSVLRLFAESPMLVKACSETLLMIR